MPEIWCLSHLSREMYIVLPVFVHCAKKTQRSGELSTPLHRYVANLLGVQRIIRKVSFEIIIMWFHTGPKTILSRGGRPVCPKIPLTATPAPPALVFSKQYCLGRIIEKSMDHKQEQPFFTIGSHFWLRNRSQDQVSFVYWFYGSMDIYMYADRDIDI